MSVIVSGAVVRELRQRRGWTQEHLSAIAGLSAKTIQRVEASGVCSLETRSALLSVFEIEIEQLAGKESIMQAEGEDEKGDLLYFNHLSTGLSVAHVLAHADAFRMTHEEPRCADDAAMFGGILQNLQDWGDLWDDISQTGRANAIYSFKSDVLDDLEENGMRLFGLRTKGTFQFPFCQPPREARLSIASFHIAYSNSAMVFVLNPAA